MSTASDATKADAFLTYALDKVKQQMLGASEEDVAETLRIVIFTSHQMLMAVTVRPDMRDRLLDALESWIIECGFSKSNDAEHIRSVASAAMAAIWRFTDALPAEADKVLAEGTAHD